jgi:hypothetical protein
MKPGSKRLVLGLLVLSASGGMAAPFGIAFTYQGRLTSGTNVSGGLYDF